MLLTVVHYEIQRWLSATYIRRHSSSSPTHTLSLRTEWVCPIFCVVYPTTHWQLLLAPRPTPTAVHCSHWTSWLPLPWRMFLHEQHEQWVIDGLPVRCNVEITHRCCDEWMRELPRNQVANVCVVYVGMGNHHQSVNGIDLWPIHNRLQQIWNDFACKGTISLPIIFLIISTWYVR